MTVMLLIPYATTNNWDVNLGLCREVGCFRHTGPRRSLDIHSSLKNVQSSLKDVHGWTFMARA